MVKDFLTYTEAQRRRLLAQRKRIDDQLQQIAAAEKLYRMAQAKESDSEEQAITPREAVRGDRRVPGSGPNKTIKDHVRELIAEKPLGLTSNEILERLQQSMPSLTRTSLSPQLSRLKAEGLLLRDDLSGRWQLTQMPLVEADEVMPRRKGMDVDDL